MQLKQARAFVAALATILTALSGCSSSSLAPVEPLPSIQGPLSASSPLFQPVVGAALPASQLPAPEPEWIAENPRPWRYIVIHHSAMDEGDAQAYDRLHRRQGWDELGYHFVIDNGKGGPDGKIEVGPRWRMQKWGAHTGGTPQNEYNNYGIGICLVGDFSKGQPSAAQLESLKKLVRYLAGTYGIPPQNIIGHRDAPGAKTECPGDSLYRFVHGELRQQQAAP